MWRSNQSSDYPVRIALISDIHGNYIALQSVLNDIAQYGVDEIICLGDVATLGPQPRKVIEKLRATVTTAIMGNHDTALLEIGTLADNKIAPPLTDAIRWAREQLNASEKAYLSTFKDTHTQAINGRPHILYFHATPTSRIENLLATTPDETIDEMFASRQEQIFIGGHTHVQMMRRHGTKIIINPGSVGNVFLHAPKDGNAPTLLPWAEYAILHVDEGRTRVDLRKIRFDLDASLAALEHSSLPTKENWIRSYSASAKRWLQTF